MISKIKLLAATLFSLVAGTALAQVPAAICSHVTNAALMPAGIDTLRVINDTSYDVTYYKLDVSASPDTVFIAGQIVIRSIAREWPATDTIILGMSDSLRLLRIRDEKGRSLGYERSMDKLLVALAEPVNRGEEFDVIIDYEGEPEPPGMLHATHFPDSTRWVVWTFSEPFWSRLWWPNKDNPADKADSADVSVTCLKRYQVGSVGSLHGVVSVNDSHHRYEWRVRYPISNYLIAFTCSEYVEMKDYWHYSDEDSMLVLQYIFPSYAQEFEIKRDTTLDILNYFSQHFGLYPFVREKYGHAQWLGGGMEHQTMSFMRNADTYLIAHEMAHQWWGDAITCKTWSDIWLNEGFATYSTNLYAGHHFGQWRYDDLMREHEDHITSVPTGRVYVPPEETRDPGRLFDGRLSYNKGSWVLHMLRGVLGDSLFFKAMREYQLGSLRYANATTEDFKHSVERSANMDLGWFFNQWVYGGGHPIYTMNTMSGEIGGKWQVMIRLDQRSSSSEAVSFFQMPIEFRVSLPGGDSLIKTFHMASGQIYTFEFNERPDSIVFDPSNWILDANYPGKTLAVQMPARTGGGAVYPNPARKGQPVRFLFEIEGRENVNVEVLNALGVVVETLYQGSVPDGSGSFEWLSQSGLAAGFYTCRLTYLDSKRSPELRSVMILN